MISGLQKLASRHTVRTMSLPASLTALSRDDLVKLVLAQQPQLAELMARVEVLVIGKTDQEVAEAVGKSRQTVCVWRLYHPIFRAELNKRRRGKSGELLLTS